MIDKDKWTKYYVVECLLRGIGGVCVGRDDSDFLLRESV